MTEDLSRVAWANVREHLYDDLRGAYVLCLGGGAALARWAAEDGAIIVLDGRPAGFDEWPWYVRERARFLGGALCIPPIRYYDVLLICLDGKRLEEKDLDELMERLIKCKGGSRLLAMVELPFSVGTPLGSMPTIGRLAVVARQAGYTRLEEFPADFGDVPGKHPGFVLMGTGSIEVTSGPVGVPSGPETLVLMLGWRCNSKCIQCWQAVSRDVGALPPFELSSRDVVGLLRRYHETLVNVELCSFGEPTVQYDFGEILGAIASAGWYPRSNGHVNLVTNGSRLDRFPLLGEMPGFLTVSIDAASREVYEAIRRGLSYDVVWRNLESAIRGKTNPQRSIGVNMTVFESNVNEVYDMAARLSSIGADYLSVLPGSGMDLTPVSSEELSRGDSRVMEQIEAAKRDHPSLPINNYFEGAAGGVKALQDGALGYCRLPWKSLDIATDFRAHPCCRSHDIDLGNCVEHDPWSGKKMNDLRSQLLAGSVDGETFPSCSRCELSGAKSK